MKRFSSLGILSLFAALSLSSFGQKDSAWLKEPSISLTGYGDVYYAHDLSQPEELKRHPFLYNHTRHNAVSINHALLKVGVDHAKYRANVGIHAGSYVDDNYTDVFGSLRSIFEANVGLALNKSNTLWLDAGILPSHIGFESALSIDNWMLTRSIVAENSPYYYSGAQLSYTPSKKVHYMFVVMNGWQRILKEPGNTLPALGTRLRIALTPHCTLNWNTYGGTEGADSVRVLRHYHNVFFEWNWNKRFQLFAGADIGAQQEEKGSGTFSHWGSVVVMGKYALPNNWFLSARGEWYKMSPALFANYELLRGSALGISYQPTPALLWRAEGVFLESPTQLLEDKNGTRRTNLTFVTSLAFRFSKG